MARPRSDYQALHAEADRFEPRLERALGRSIEKAREAVSVNTLAMALAAKDVKAAMAQLPPPTLQDALSPAGTIARDAFARGGRVAADQVNDARTQR